MAIAISWIDARAFEGNNFQEGTTFVTNLNLLDLKFQKQFGKLPSCLALEASHRPCVSS